MKLNPYGWRSRQRLIILLEASAHVAGLDTNNWIVACSIAGNSLEDLDPDDAFLQLFGVAIQLVPDNVFQKLSASRGAFEKLAFENSIQFFEYKNCVLLPNRCGLDCLVDFAGIFGSGGHMCLLRQPKGHSEQSLQ